MKNRNFSAQRYNGVDRNRFSIRDAAALALFRLPTFLWSWLGRFPCLKEPVLKTRFLKGEELPEYFGTSTAETIELIPGLYERSPQAVEQAGKLIGPVIGPSVDIGEFAHCSCGRNTDFTGKKVAVVAHWDPEGIIDPYVRHYLTHLREIGYETVLTSDKPALSSPDPAWLTAAVWRSCPGYDFTSWKAAFHVFPTLFLAEEVVLANDSVFAPIGSFGPVHDAMRSVDCDFWGLCESHKITPHLQSYYLLFRSRALQHQAFREFLAMIKADDDRVAAVGYETALSIWLTMHGLRPAAWVPATSLPLREVNPAHFFWRQLINLYGVPVLKRNVLTRSSALTTTADWRRIVEEKGYPAELIRNYLRRCRHIENLE